MDVWSYGGLAVAFILIVLLIAKLIANSTGSPKAKAISEVLNIPVLVFLALSVLAIIFRVVTLLG